MARLHYGPARGAFVIAALVVFFPRELAAQLQRYAINPGGQYTYLPSPEGPGIPGGMPSAYELDFGVTGFFSVEYSDTTARLLDVDLMLIGNEAVQSNPPGLALVTADRVAEWLESRRFIRQPIGAPFSGYTDEVIPLGHSNYLDGTVSIDGGFDFTPADGIGVNFRLNATLVPEPAGWLLACMAMATLAALLRRRSTLRRAQ
jgi:hypothetical protein